MSMPRLIYVYWMVIAAVMTAAGLIISLLLRRRHYFSWLLKATALPLSLLLAIVLTLAGHFNEVYNAVYYFSGIMIVALALWAVMCILLDRWLDKRKKQNIEDNRQ